jgi:hypothetical protein
MDLQAGNRRCYARVSSLEMAIACCTFALLPLVFLAGCSTSHAQPAKGVMKLTAADYIEIYQLYSAYAVGLDTGNGPARIATFTPDGTFSWGYSNFEPESMATVLKRTNGYGRRNRPMGMYHILMDMHITPTADGAVATCYIAGPVPIPQQARNKVSAAHIVPTLSLGFYTDTLVKTPEGWRFKHRTFRTAQEDEILPTIK